MLQNTTWCRFHLFFLCQGFKGQYLTGMKFSAVSEIPPCCYLFHLSVLYLITQSFSFTPLITSQNDLISNYSPKKILPPLECASLCLPLGRPTYWNSGLMRKSVWQRERNARCISQVLRDCEELRAVAVTLHCTAQSPGKHSGDGDAWFCTLKILTLLV